MMKQPNTWPEKRRVLLLTPLALAAAAAQAVPLPGGTLDPLTIPKYVTPLVIPPVMNTTTDALSGLPVPNDYDIAVRQFKQQILPGGIWATLNPAITAPLPATTVWSYGPAADPTPTIAPDPTSQFNYPAYTIEATKDTAITVDWINDLVDANGNALPHLLKNALGGTVVDQTLHWANPAADCVMGEVRTDCHGFTDQPYEGPVPIVTHVHGAHVGAESDGYTEAWWLPNANNITCVPRDPATGLLTTQPGGYNPADGTWNVACEGTIANRLTDRTGNVAVNTNVTPGVGSFVYQNDQPSATIWYHDHSLGMTRLNVYAGPAGFWLIRDPLGVNRETGLVSGILPGPAPVAGQGVLALNVPGDPVRNGIREIPIAIQDRSFNADGSLFYPDSRSFFDGYTGPYAGQCRDVVAGTAPVPCTAAGLTDGSLVEISDMAPVWNPEAFFNTMVVNGTTWPKLEVAPALYRFRLLNGCNSRVLNLALKTTDALGNPVRVNKTIYKPKKGVNTFDQKIIKISELEFFQIGTEQSLLPQVVAVSTGFATPLVGKSTVQEGKITNARKAPNAAQALLLGLAERADVIVDFRGLPNGTIVTLFNTGPDAPFGGFPAVPVADPATTGQVMRFVVNNALLGASPTDELRGTVKPWPVLNPTAATSPESLVLGPVDGGTVTPAPNPVPRQLALVEEESALVCVTVDALTGAITPVLDPTSPTGYEIPLGPGLCPTPTALPMAPKAAVLGTVGAGVPTVTLWSDPIVTNVATGSSETWEFHNFTIDAHPIHVHEVKFQVRGRRGIAGGPSIVAGRGIVNGVQAWENGWKDTVLAYPGEVTSVSANFGIAGLYVWHCHIVEHEDNEMMVPYCIGSPGTDCPNGLF